MRNIFCFACMLPALLLLTCYSYADTAGLNKQLEQLAVAKKNRMDIGIAYKQIETGKSWSYNGHKKYPLASVFKVPIMICILQKIDAGQLTLTDKITMNESDKCIGGGQIQYKPAGTSFSVSNLLYEMITVSDNTATDLLWKKLGNNTVYNFMKNNGFNNSDIYTANRASYLIALGQGSEFKGKTGKEIAKIWNSKNYQSKQNSIAKVLAEHKNLTLAQFQAIEDKSFKTSTYSDDIASAEAVDNLSTPYDFTDLFARLYKREFLSEALTKKALAIMADCRFNSRIPAKLPKGVKVYHKTGTICGIVNDSGIIEISPGNNVAVTIFIKNIQSGYEGEANITSAQISRLIYDEFKK